MRQHLLSKLAAVRRSIYATSSIGFRLAAVLIKFSLDATILGFGQALYKVFLKEGVTGLPPVGGVPVEEVDPKRIPIDYGKDFANIVYHALVRQARGTLRGGGEDFAYDVMQEVALKASQGIPALQGRSLQEAQSYILKMASWRLKDLLRTHKGRPMESLDVPVGQENKTPLVEMLENPRSMPHLYEALAGRDFRKVLPKIERDLRTTVNEGAVQYLEALLEDPEATDIELVGDTLKGVPPMLPYFIENPVSNTNFRTRIRPKIVKVLRENLQEVV